MANCSENHFGHEATVHLADADWADARLFVQCNKSACHERPVGSPWGTLVRKQVGQGGQFMAQCFRLGTEA